MKNDDDFFKKLQATFKIEAEEHLAEITSGLIELEKGPQPETAKTLIETIYRGAHSLKGAARAVNMIDLQDVCQALESAFGAVRSGKIRPEAAHFDVFHGAVNLIGAMLSSPDEPHEAMPLIETLERIGSGQFKQPDRGTSMETPSETTGEKRPQTATEDPKAAVQRESPQPIHALSDTVRVSSDQLRKLLLEAEDMLSIKIQSSRLTKEISETISFVESWKKEWSRLYPALNNIRRSLAKDGLDGADIETSEGASIMSDFLDGTYGWIRSIESRLSELRRSARYNQNESIPMIDRLLYDVKKIYSMPVSTLLEPFSKIVRDLSRDQGKEVLFAVEGGDITIDRRILDELRTPMMHLIRNAVNHGIEPPALRKKNNKPDKGTIAVTVVQTGTNRVEVSVADDGRGIDFDRLEKAIMKLNLIDSGSGDKELDQGNMMTLLFRSGVTTSAIITDISGRGLGLAIVKEGIEKLGGSISVATKQGAGTTFTAILPLMMSTFRGVCVRVAGQDFIIPTSAVERIYRIANGEVKTVENREIIVIDGAAIPYIPLNRVLDLPSPRKNGESTCGAVVVIAVKDQRLAFAVDDLVGEEEFLVKDAGKLMSRLPAFMGATILGSGRVAPVLDPKHLATSAENAYPKPSVQSGEGTADKETSILVVEDSITSRMLLKNILETAGYRVATAVDGLDGFTKMRERPFNLVVSDVDMPRMNGFELTTKIRSDKRFSELPVILVTALESRSDRERGIDAGANAYIVKSSFDQSNLLDVIERLL